MAPGESLAREAAIPGWLWRPTQALCATRFRPHPSYVSLMIRIAISLAAYQALASTMPEGTARPPEPLEVGEGVGMWIDHATLAALKRERRAGEGWSEVILRMTAQAD
jgi:hypothetical protein